MSFDPSAPFNGTPRVERVERAESADGSLVVRVAGRGLPVGGSASAAVLLVRGDRRQFRFPALPGEQAGGEDDGAWRAAFAVPAELRAGLERDLVLEVGSLAMRLPAPEALALAELAGAGSANVVDRGVLAERRARRAELGEEREALRAAEAEAHAAELRVKVAQLEADLADLRSAPDERGGEIESLRVELLRARQKAYAEEQVRLEAVAEARRETRDAEQLAADERERVTELEARLAAERFRARVVDAPSSPAAPTSPLAPLVAALALERAMAAARPRRAQPDEGYEGAVAAEPAEPALAAAELEPALAAEPAPAPPASEPAPAPPGPTPDRLEAARVRLRGATLPAPILSGPADPGRLPGALRRLARRDPAAGGRIVAALTPAQHLVAPAAYDLAIADVRTLRVRATGEATEIAAHPGGADVRVETDAAGLGRLVLGSRVRRLRARRYVEIDGRRRALRPLRRLGRTPLAWERLAGAAVSIDAGIAYRWIALAVDPDWTRGQRFTIAHTGDGDPDGRWFVRAEDGRPLAVTAEPPRDRPAAEIVCPDAGLAAFLGGVEPLDPADAARVTGDRDAVALLVAWANGRRD